MTEYNYSPDAERKFYEKMGSVGRWAQGTEHERPNYRVPFGTRSDAGYVSDEYSDDESDSDEDFEHLRSPSVIGAPTYQYPPQGQIIQGQYVNVAPWPQQSASTSHIPIPSFGQAIHPPPGFIQPTVVNGSLPPTFFPHSPSSTTTLTSPNDRYSLYPSQRFSPSVASSQLSPSPIYAPNSSAYAPSAQAQSPPPPQPILSPAHTATPLRSVASTGKLQNQHSRSLSAVQQPVAAPTSVYSVPYYPVSLPTSPYPSPPISPVPMTVATPHIIVMPSKSKHKKKKHRSRSRSKSRSRKSHTQVPVYYQIYPIVTS